MLLRTLRLVRWRTNSPEGQPNPIRYSTKFEWSVDGIKWKEETLATSISVKLTVNPQWTREFEEFVAAEAATELDEPLAHEMLREAALNRTSNPRSSFILAVAAAEVGFKQFAAQTLPDTGWILEKLPSPPLVDMFKAYPWDKLNVQINSKPLAIPDPIKRELSKAVTLRNKIVHVGVVKLESHAQDSVLSAVRDLLYFLDAARGHKWALAHIRHDTLQQFE